MYETREFHLTPDPDLNSVGVNAGCAIKLVSLPPTALLKNDLVNK
jgi:hypothetical protein